MRSEGARFGWTWKVHSDLNFCDPGRIFFKSKVNTFKSKVNTFSWWSKHWLSHRIVYCKMVSLMLSGFHLSFSKMTLTQLWAMMMYSRPQKVKGDLTSQMGFHCGFDSLAVGYWIFPWEWSHPKGMLVFVLGEPSPSRVWLSSPWSSQKIQSEGILWKEHCLFIRTNCSFPEWPTDVVGWAGQWIFLQIAPSTNCSWATWQKTYSIFKQSCLLGHRLHKANHG